MKLKRMLKRLIVTICVVALMLPSFSNVALAAFETAKDSKTTFGISILHPLKLHLEFLYYTQAKM